MTSIFGLFVTVHSDSVCVCVWGGGQINSVSCTINILASKYFPVYGASLKLTFTLLEWSVEKLCLALTNPISGGGAHPSLDTRYCVRACVHSIKDEPSIDVCPTIIYLAKSTYLS